MNLSKYLIPLLFLILLSCAQIDSPKTIDLSEKWRFSPDEQNKGLSEKWYGQNYNDSQWAVIDAGERWEDQGFPDVDSMAWYRKEVHIPREWKNDPVFLVFGAVNDAYTLYVNGQQVNAFGSLETMGVSDKMTVTEVSRHLQFGEANSFAIRVYDFGASGGLWRLPVMVTADENETENLGILSTYNRPAINELWVNIVHSCLGAGNKGREIQIQIQKVKSEAIVANHSQQINEHTNATLAKIPMPEPQKNSKYQVRAKILGPEDETFLVFSKKVMWNPLQLPPDENGVKQLNNFVDELVNIKITDTPENIIFNNPRQGWILISVKPSSVSAKPPKVNVNDQPENLMLRINQKTGAYESMQFLPQGEQKIVVKNSVNAKLIVRSIPEIIYSDHPSSPHIKPYGVYDWNYLSKYVLSHVNTIVTSASSLAQSERDQWIREGRCWIIHAGLPGLGRKTAPDPKEVYNVWSNNPGTKDPSFNGIIVDEFLRQGHEHYRAYTEALFMLYENPSFSAKSFYAYSNHIFYAPDAPAIPFGKKLLKHEGRFALERYIPEQPTEAEALLLLSEELRRPYLDIKNNLPGGEKNLIITLGYLTDPTESLSIYPMVDYRVFMDMQFHLLATDPTFKDLYGLQEYLSSYADEELLRWAHQLFRHYCIEGKRSRFTNDPYILTHIQNPDFAEGLKHWTVEQEEKGGIEVGSMLGYSWLQGRYPRTTYGDHFVRFKRSARKSNKIRQTIKSLEPGRLYSLKLRAADLNALDKKQKLALSIKIDGVELIGDDSFRFVYPSNYSHTLGPYNRNNPAWFNFYRIVFRPKGKTAELTISDWSSPTHSTGQAGQEIICNFIEIQPFYEK